jgi:type 1 glutamine amidotransferase
MSRRSLLYVTQVAPYRDGPAGVHGVLDQSATAVAELAEAAGLAFERVTDVRALDASALASVRVLALFTIGETPWSASQRITALDGVRSGHSSILAVHSATDACYGWDDYRLLVGARFDGHPWTQRVTLDVGDPTHPAVAHLGPTWSWHDEIYTFRELRPDARVLLSVRPEELGSGPSAGSTDRHGAEAVADPTRTYPLSWCFSEGAGRVFSSSLGHFPHAWENTDYLRHLAGGLDWVLAAGPAA